MAIHPENQNKLQAAMATIRSSMDEKIAKIQQQSRSDIASTFTNGDQFGNTLKDSFDLLLSDIAREFKDWTLSFTALTQQIQQSQNNPELQEYHTALTSTFSEILTTIAQELGIDSQNIPKSKLAEVLDRRLQYGTDRATLCEILNDTSLTIKADLRRLLNEYYYCNDIAQLGTKFSVIIQFEGFHALQQQVHAKYGVVLSDFLYSLLAHNPSTANNKPISNHKPISVVTTSTTAHSNPLIPATAITNEVTAVVMPTIPKNLLKKLAIAAWWIGWASWIGYLIYEALHKTVDPAVAYNQAMLEQNNDKTLSAPRLVVLAIAWFIAYKVLQGSSVTTSDEGMWDASHHNTTPKKVANSPWFWTYFESMFMNDSGARLEIAAYKHRQKKWELKTVSESTRGLWEFSAATKWKINKRKRYPNPDNEHAAFNAIKKDIDDWRVLPGEHKNIQDTMSYLLTHPANDPKKAEERAYQAEREAKKELDAAQDTHSRRTWVNQKVRIDIRDPYEEGRSIVEWAGGRV